MGGNGDGTNVFRCVMFSEIELTCFLVVRGLEIPDESNLQVQMVVLLSVKIRGKVC